PEMVRAARPSRRLLQESDAVLAVPESEGGRVSAALATCLENGAVTLAPRVDREGDLQDGFLPLPHWPDCGIELAGAISSRAARRRVITMPRSAPRPHQTPFQSRDRQTLELSQVIERCQPLRPERPEPLRVWRDVLGTRTAELEGLSLTAPDPEILQWNAE